METATYTKLRSGDWGVRVTGTVRPGQTVNVVKRSGEAKNERIDRVVWTDGKIALCSIIPASGTGSGSGTCPDCGDAVRSGYRYCRDCSIERREGGSRYAGGMSYRDSHGRFVLGEDD